MTQPLDVEEILTKSDIDEMVATTDNLRDKALIAFQFEAGLRTTELTNQTILRLKPVIGGNGFEVIVHGKSGSRTIRVIKCSNSVKRWLEVHPASGRAKSPVWTFRDELRSLSSLEIRRIFDRAATRAGVEKRATPKAVRRACARRLLEMGMPPRYICVWLGLSCKKILPPTPSTEVNQWYEQKIDRESEQESASRYRGAHPEPADLDDVSETLRTWLENQEDQDGEEDDE